MWKHWSKTPETRGSGILIALKTKEKPLVAISAWPRPGEITLLIWTMMILFILITWRNSSAPLTIIRALLPPIRICTALILSSIRRENGVRWGKKVQVSRSFNRDFLFIDNFVFSCKPHAPPGIRVKGRRGTTMMSGFLSTGTWSERWPLFQNLFMYPK